MKDMPVTVKRSIELLGIFVAGVIIVIGKAIIMPLLLAFFVSILLMPLFRFFKKIRMPEIVAIFLSILCLTIFAALVGWLFYGQASSLAGDLPVIQNTMNRHLDNLSVWIGSAFGFSPDEQVRLINKNSSRLFGLAEGALKQVASSLPGMFIFFGLLPIYIFFIILYRNRFVNFVLMWSKTDKHEDVKLVISKLESVVKSYLLGLLIQFAYIIILLGGTLMIVGIPHGFLIAILFAFLNLIPYLGPLIGNILGVLITLASSDRIADVLIVFAVITIVQFLDNNILMPRIVGSQVKINALASIVGIFIGGALAGISGMFLAMPVIAVMKILFDHSVNFKQWGVLLGDERSVVSLAGISGRRRHHPR